MARCSSLLIPGKEAKNQKTGNLPRKNYGDLRTLILEGREEARAEEKKNDERILAGLWKISTEETAPTRPSKSITFSKHT